MIFKWERLQNVQMPSVIIITEFILLKKLIITQTFTTAISAPMEMSYNQMQPQAIVSEPNSKALSIKKKKKTNIIHLSLFCIVILSGEQDTRPNITLPSEAGLLPPFNLRANRCSAWHLCGERNNNHLQLQTSFLSLLVIYPFCPFSISFCLFSFPIFLSSPTLLSSQRPSPFLSSPSSLLPPFRVLVPWPSSITPVTVFNWQLNCQCEFPVLWFIFSLGCFW